MSDIQQARAALITQILEGHGCTTRARRRAAFDNSDAPEPLRTLIEKVANDPNAVTDHDIAAARASGSSEDEIFELVVCAAIGQATRQHDAALAALTAATGKG